MTRCLQSHTANWRRTTARTSGTAGAVTASAELEEEEDFIFLLDLKDTKVSGRAEAMKSSALTVRHLALFSMDMATHSVTMLKGMTLAARVGPI
jgi:hypothetical protein